MATMVKDFSDALLFSIWWMSERTESLQIMIMRYLHLPIRRLQIKKTILKAFYYRINSHRDSSAAIILILLSPTGMAAMINWKIAGSHAWSTISLHWSARSATRNPLVLRSDESLIRLFVYLIIINSIILGNVHWVPEAGRRTYSTGNCRLQKTSVGHEWSQ